MVAVIVVLVLLLGAFIGAVAYLRRRVHRVRVAAVDPFTLGEPWRRHVAAAQAAQRRYDQIVRNAADGPLRDRLAQIGAQIQRSVEECGEIARRGNELDGALKRFNSSSLKAQLDRQVDEPTRASLGAQLDSASRIRSTRDRTEQRLRLLDTRLGEIIARVAEISVSGPGAAGVADVAGDDLGTAVDDVVTELEALRLAVEEVDAASPSGGAVIPVLLGQPPESAAPLLPATTPPTTEETSPGPSDVATTGHQAAGEDGPPQTSPTT